MLPGVGPAGRAIFIVPNRASLWARREGTPFSFARPYTAGQLESRLKWHGFLPEHHVMALYQPPWSGTFWRRMSGPIERIGQNIPAWRGGGVLILEVSKQVPRPRQAWPGADYFAALGILEGIKLQIRFLRNRATCDSLTDSAFFAALRRNKGTHPSQMLYFLNFLRCFWPSLALRRAKCSAKRREILPP